MGRLVVLALVPLFFCQSLLATTEPHEPVRRLVVFPILTERQFSSVAEEIWWDMRERLSETRRFLIASRNFLQSKDVFHARGALEPADAIILGRLLDAQALMTTYVEENNLKMSVYDGSNGSLLWAQEIILHPSLPISQQLGEATQKLAFDFVASIPYQGYVVTDSLIGRPVYKEGGRELIKVEVGVGSQIAPGDSAQVVAVKPKNLEALFGAGLSIEVLSEGTVVNVVRQQITVQLNRKREDYEPRENALVRFPNELKRLQEVYSIHEGAAKNIDVEFVRGDMEVLTPEQKEKKPLVTALSFIGNLALILLMAF